MLAPANHLGLCPDVFGFLTSAGGGFAQLIARDGKEVPKALSHAINQHFSTRLQYGFFYYDEPTLAGFNDYQAHTVVASLTYHFH